MTKLKTCYYTILLLVGLVTIKNINAQAPTSTLTPTKTWECGYDQTMMQQLSGDTGFVNGYARYSALQNAGGGNQVQSGAPYIVPVVFHVISTTSLTAVLPYAQIQWQMARLNAAFNDQLLQFTGKSSGPRNVNTQIQFRLACVAQNCGNGFSNINEPGVMRYQTANTLVLNQGVLASGTIGPMLAITHPTTCTPVFPTANYLNIWCVPNITSPPGSITIGYGTFPWLTASIDGIVMRIDCIGNQNYPTGFNILPGVDKGSIFAHEAGHYLGLLHTFETVTGGNVATAGSAIGCLFNPTQEGDMISDTPPTSLVGDVPFFSTWNSCTESYFPYGGGGNADENDQLENYMCYSDDDKLNTFTQDQTNRMISFFTTVGPKRYNLNNPTNLSITGINPNSCANTSNILTGIFNYSVAPNSSCANISVQFTNPTGLGFSATSYSYSFGDGSSILATSPIHTYTAPLQNTYAVSCIATNSLTGQTASYTQTISISVNIHIVGQSGTTVCKGTEQTIFIEFGIGVPSATLFDGTNIITVLNTKVFTNTLVIVPYNFIANSSASYSLVPSICNGVSLGVANFSVYDCCQTLITNGDFVNGNTGFNTELTTIFSPTTGGSCDPPQTFQYFGTYTVMPAAAAGFAPNFINSPVGNRALRVDAFACNNGIVNVPFGCASTTMQPIVWQQTLNGLKPNTDYIYSYKVTENYNNIPCLLNFATSISSGTIIALASQTIVPSKSYSSSSLANPVYFETHTYKFTTPASISPTTNFSVTINQINNFRGGYFDFAIDNIELHEIRQIKATSSTTICSGGNTTLMAVASCSVNINNYKFTWLPSSSLSCSTCISPVANPTVTTVYTLVSTPSVVTNPASPVFVSTVTVTVDNNCSFCTIGTSYDGALQPQIVHTGIFSLNQTLSVQNFTLSNAVVYMGTNAEVVIANNGVLVIEDSHILGCPAMWKGFRFEGPNGNVIIKKGPSLRYNPLIEDALIAVDLTKVIATSTVMPSAKIININDAVFNKNYTAIAVANYTAAADYPATLINNVFTSRKLITINHQAVNPLLVPTYTWTNNNVLTTSLKTFTPIASPNTYSVITAPFNVNDQFNIAANYSSATLEYPNTSTIGRNGITVESVANNSITAGFAIGTSTTQATIYSMNLFDNLNYGIYATNSNVFVSNTAFQYIQQYKVAVTDGCIGKGCPPPVVAYFGGVALYSLNDLPTIVGRLFQLKALPNTAPTTWNTSGNLFFNNAISIKVSNVQYATINNNIIHSKRVYSAPPKIAPPAAPMMLGQNGILYNSSDYRLVDIVKNVGVNLNTAIWFRADYTPYTDAATDVTFNAQKTGSVNIAQNKLSANYVATIGTTGLDQGIVVDNILNQTTANTFTTTATDIIRVNNNNITNAISGIAVNNFKREPVYTYSNTITMINSLPVANFALQNVSQYGIIHQNNSKDQIKGNTVTGFSPSVKTNLYAIYARDNVREQITCNTTNSTYEGFTFAGAANLTAWKNNSMTNHTRGMHLNNTTIGNQGTATTPIQNVWGTGNTWQTYVTGIDPGLIPNSKLYLGTLPTLNDGAPTANKYKTTIPASLFNATGTSGINCATAPIANPNGNNGNANGNTGNGNGNGNNGNGNGNGGSVANNPNFATGIEGNLKNIVMDAYPYDRHLQGNRKNGKFLVYTELVADTTIYGNDSIMKAFYEQSKTSAIGDLVSTESLLATAKLSQAESKLQTTITTDVVEQNSLRFYQLYIATKNNSLDVSSFGDLLNLANACPESDGVAVYQARVLYNSVVDMFTQFEDNCPATTNSSRLMQQSKNEAEPIISKSFIVYPNPSNGKIFFTADNLGLDSYDIKVYDVTGKQVYNQHYADGIGVKALQLNLTNGLYTIHLTNIESNATYIQKMVIQQ